MDAGKSVSAASRDGGAAALASPSPATLTLTPTDPAAASTEQGSSSPSPSQTARLPLQSVSDDRRRVAILPGCRAAEAAGKAGAAAGNGKQARCGSATGILREPRVYTSGAASTPTATPCNPVQSSLRLRASSLQPHASRLQPCVCRRRQRWR